MESFISRAFVQESTGAKLIYVPCNAFDPSQLSGLTTHYIQLGDEMECYIKSECDTTLFNLALNNLTITRTFKEWCILADLDPTLANPNYNNTYSIIDFAKQVQPIGHPDSDVVMCFYQWATCIFTQLLRSRQRFIDQDIADSVPLKLRTPVDLKEHMIELFRNHINTLDTKYDAFKTRFVEKITTINTNVPLKTLKNDIGKFILGLGLLNPIKEQDIGKVRRVITDYLLQNKQPNIQVLVQNMKKTNLYSDIDILLRTSETEHLPLNKPEKEYKEALVHTWLTKDALVHLDPATRGSLVEFNTQTYTKITAMELEMVEYNKIKLQVEKENNFILQAKNAVKTKREWSDTLYNALVCGSKKHYRIFLSGLKCLLN